VHPTRGALACANLRHGVRRLGRPGASWPGGNTLWRGRRGYGTGESLGQARTAPGGNAGGATDGGVRTGPVGLD